MGCPIKRIIQFQEADIYKPIEIYDDQHINVTNQCKYSWSSDSVCWTNWVNYESYKNITPQLDSDFYLRILIFGSLSEIFFNGVLNSCYNICIDNTNPFLAEFCNNTNLFQPYNNLDCALLLQQQLSDSIVCMFGIPVYYFQVQPREESIDYTFKEFKMHDVVNVKQIKLMIQDGAMPSSNPKLTDFDFDWETDWETEISKTQFAKAFGDNAFPTANDFLYIPMMKRMWEVNAAYDEKQEGLLWRSTTWKLSLVKYNDATNVITDKFDNIIDDWIINTYDNTFGDLEKIEQERESGTNQIDSPKFAATPSPTVATVGATADTTLGPPLYKELPIPLIALTPILPIPPTNKPAAGKAVAPIAPPTKPALTGSTAPLEEAMAAPAPIAAPATPRVNVEPIPLVSLIFPNEPNPTFNPFLKALADDLKKPKPILYHPY